MHMNMTVLWIILGMLVVTYIPRALPAVLIGKVKFPPAVERFLNLIPYTAMAALVFPGVFSIDTSHPFIGIIGIVVAGILAWFKLPVIVAVLGAILSNVILYLVI